MLLFLSVTGIFLSVILLYFNTRNNRSTLYLGLFFLFLSMYCLFQYILLYSKSVTLISLFLFNIAIISSPVYLIGPMLYWYFRSVLTDDSRLKRKDTWHFLPMVIYFIAAFPHSFVTWEEKVEVAKALALDVNLIQTYKATLLSAIFPVSFEYLSRPLLVLGYTIWSAGMFISYLRKGKVTAVFSRQRFMKKWLCIFLGFLVVLVVTQILQIIRGFKMDFSELYFHINNFRMISAVGLFGLLITPFFFPNILYGMPRMDKSNVRKDPVLDSNIPSNDPVKKSFLRFEQDYLDSIGHRADLCMTEKKSYLKPDFNLADLSIQTQIPVHHLAYYFRETRKQHFVDYRNKWRVNHAKNLISKGLIRKTTLENIAMESGFSNRNTFLAAFKKFEGTVPHSYAIRQTRNSEPSS